MKSKQSSETLVGAVCLALGALMAWGATSIASEAGYAGVGPNFLPWVVSIALIACGVFLLTQALTGGFRGRDEPEGAERGDWLSFAFISAALLLNALLITRIGFIASCTLAFVIAVRGFHLSQGRSRAPLSAWLKDALVGAAISAPVFWLFTKVLGVSLPGLTSTGWL
ncbi:tripartite tricarboxylate transporter TctB family protein [Variovorax sp. PCZ-1]|uniref:tripartite tricarboxylate transporter TctB family protein n=1 Tax=Variovorax sp. PCZ-1 TaxID=2835533 RepID=UPI001BCCDCC1|nr:tripartite tricarboxylate transporter TctB family protein [Variovorax sp. PCZ-1]MBS7806634.1 tripartite tricarboxylate transporter TctB family protein [Variovorax sp. PCZ-1]